MHIVVQIVDATIFAVMYYPLPLWGVEALGIIQLALSGTEFLVGNLT